MSTFYPDSLLGRLELHSQQFSDRPIYTFLSERGNPETQTFSQLSDRVRTLAAVIRTYAKPGDRAVLLYPQGLEFISAFLACLAAGVIAVPAYPPKRNRKADRINSILNDCSPTMLLTTSQVRATLPGNLTTKPVVNTDEFPTDGALGWRTSCARSDTPAFLQYTSGSTGTPKGVIVTHGNISVNEQQIQRNFGHVSWNEESQVSTMVTWLPLFHDMGLVGGVLQGLYVGFPSVILSPVAFLQEPLRWLTAISTYRGTTAGAPNFAYDHCARTVTEQEKTGLDLSSLRVLYNGAEPIRAETLDRFVEAFRTCGFRSEAFFPCYGLAEATLFLSGGPELNEPRRIWLDSADLQRDVVTPTSIGASGSTCLVSSGALADGAEIVAVDPVTRQPARTGTVGELWARSGGVAAGYWSNDSDTAETFDNRLEGTGAGPYLATGDLGFVIDRDVYVTGRLKDLIVIHGRNVYPQDVEVAVERALPLVEANGCAAFAIETAEDEQLALVIEADRSLVRTVRETSSGNGTAASAKSEVEAMVRRVRAEVAEAIEVPVHVLAFVRPGTFPRTSSGKVQRRRCREILQAGSDDIIWTSDLEKSQDQERPSPTGFNAAGKTELLQRLRRILATRLNCDVTAIPDSSPLTAFGIDSLRAAELVQSFESLTGWTLPLRGFLDNSSLSQLVQNAEPAAKPSTICQVLSSEQSQRHSVRPADCSCFDEPHVKENGRTKLFADERVQAISRTFSAGRSNGLIQHYADDEPLTGRTIPIGERDLVNFVTCSYLGLEFDPRVIEGIHQAANRYGASFIVSRAYASAPSFAEFERLLGEIFEAYPVVVPSTTLGHLSFMSVMIQRGDVIILDQQVHNSVQLAALTVQGKATLVPTSHNDMARLEQLVERYLAKPETNRVWYCADGVYSMHGDLAPVGDLLGILSRHERFHCYIDDAHGMSTRGRHGRGYVLSCQEQLHHRMVVAVSLSKSFGIGCGGALVFPCREWRDMVQTCGATMIFSSPVPPPMLGAGIAAAKIHLSPELPGLQAELQARITKFGEVASELGIDLLSDSSSPVQYVMIGDFERAQTVAKDVLNDGFFVSICAYPAVAINQSGVRLTLSRHVSETDIHGVLSSIARALIKNPAVDAA
jgi:acyl-CoA synthetase (AMP-forming)/AMP-acid ligase II/7-keto-8-aminopelargonate synthetase-like enzyme/acyl carrier protein